MSKIAQKIRLARQQRNLSQENVAEMLQISLTAYSKIERGITDINFSRLEQIAKIFEIEVEELVASQSNYTEPKTEQVEAKEAEILYLKKIITLLEDKIEGLKK